MKSAVIKSWDKVPVVLDLHDAALVFGVTEETIKRWLYSGEISGRKIGRRWFFDKDYLRELIQGR